MKHTNLILVMLLVVALLLTGCSGKDEADVGGQITPAPATTPVETTPPATDSPAPEPTSAPEPAPVPAPAPDPVPET